MEAALIASQAGREINPNVDFLKDKRCPECGAFGPFETAAICRVRIYDNGTEVAGGPEYDDESPTACCNCHHEARLSDFDE
jgi:hypothetical protein